MVGSLGCGRGHCELTAILRLTATIASGKPLFAAGEAKNPPKGPNLEKFQDLEIFQELEMFKRATHQTLFFCGEFWRSGLKISSEIEIFKRD